MKPGIVFWHDQVESFLRFLDFDEFQNFQVVFLDFQGHGEWRDVYYINVRVFHRENSHNLCILFLFKLFDWQSSHFCDRKRIDMNFNPLLLPDLWPAALEFILHFSPDLSWLVIKLMHLVLGLFLQRVKSIFTLDYRSLFHEVFKLSKRRVGLISAPCCLNSDGGQYRSIRALEAMLWIVHAVVDLNSIRDTRK